MARLISMLSTIRLFGFIGSIGLCDFFESSVIEANYSRTALNGASTDTQTFNLQPESVERMQYFRKSLMSPKYWSFIDNHLFKSPVRRSLVFPDSNPDFGFRFNRRGKSRGRAPSASGCPGTERSSAGRRRRQSARLRPVVR